jgi:acetolactate synthase I/II/III large subunit
MDESTTQDNQRLNNTWASVPAVVNVSKILVRCLQAEGVEFLWGYPGGALLYIYDALYKQKTIEYI